MRYRFAPIRAAAAILVALLISGCFFDVPITPAPTRPVQPALLGNWTATEVEPTAECRDRMRIRKNDDSSYIVSLNDELYRAYHSDLDGIPLITAQEIDSPDRKYSYIVWKLSADSSTLEIRVVTDEIVPKDVRGSETVQRILREKLQTLEVLGEPLEFQRKK